MFGEASPPPTMTVGDVTYTVVGWRILPWHPALELSLMEPDNVWDQELAFLSHARQTLREAFRNVTIPIEVERIEPEMQMKIEIVKAVKLPRVEFGIDHGRERILIAQHGQKRVWRRPGFTGWGGVGMTSYYPATLEYENLSNPSSMGLHTKVLKEGGRLSRQLLRQCEVDTLLGALVTMRWKPGHSVIVTDGEAK